MIKKLTAKTLVNRSEVKEHLRVEHILDDSLIDSYIRTAMEYIEDYTSLSYGVQSFEEYVIADIAEKDVFLSMNPVNSITEVLEIDEVDGTQTDVTSDIVSITNALGTRIKTNPAKSYKVTYSAGEAEESLPYQMRQALLLIVADMYEHREDRPNVKVNASQRLLNQIAVRRI
jgi:uncharacterized phiE125 gp8 family phage protein